MGKKKKTREQKKLAELKRQQTKIQAQKEQKTSISTSFTYQIPKVQQPSTFTSSTAQKNDFFSAENYLIIDLRRTIFVSGSIFILELIVFFVLQTQKLGLLSLR